jgi:hypothetical protein
MQQAQENSVMSYREPNRLPRLVHWLIGAALLCIVLPGPALAAIAYDVTLHTSVVAGQIGFLDLQFNPGQSAGAPQAAATLSQFALGGGTLGGTAQIDGDVTGSLPSAVVFANSTGLNAILQPVSSIGDSVSFRVTFGGDFLTTSSSVGTVFSFALLDSAFAPLLVDDPAGYSVVTFELSGNGAVTPSVFASAASVDAVPEPHAWLLVLAGLGAMAVVLRRTQAARRWSAYSATVKRS